MNKETATFGNSEAISVFEEFSTDRERISKNTSTYKDDKTYMDIFDVEVGNVYSGKLMEIHDREYIFDIGYKTYVNVLKTAIESDSLDKLSIGDSVDVLIQDILDSSLYVIYGSVSAAKEMSIREKLSNMEDYIIAYIKDLTPSGYIATITVDDVELNAFMPHILAGANKILNIDRDKLVGKHLEVCLEGFSSDRGTYIINRKEYLKRLIPEKIKLLKRDVLYTGVITGTTDFGIFVEFDEYLTGMIYKTYISDELKEMLKNSNVDGLEIQFYVKDIFKDKIILTQVLKDSMWDLVKVNDFIDGTIKNITNIGVLVSIDDETNGMIRKYDSSLDLKNYNIGSEIKAKVLSIDRSNRKIFLTDQF